MARGSKTERKPGTWTLRWDLPTPPGVPRQQSSATFHGGAREADRELRRRVTEAEAGARAPARKTVATYLEEWLEASRATLAPNTTATYAHFVRRLSVGLGSVPLTQLSAVQIQRHYARELETGPEGMGALAPSSLGTEHATLHRALRQAVRWRLLPRNPADDVTLPRVVPPEIAALTPADLRRFMDAAGPALRAPLVVAILTGIRKGELLGLGWEHVDWETGTLRVTRQLRRGDGCLEYAPPKSGAAGRRTLRLPDLALAELRRHQRDQEDERRLVPDWQEHGLVFPGRDGRPWHLSTFSEAYRRLRREAGFPAVRFHDLRHASLTLLHALGVPQRVVQARAGHASSAMTNRYLHVLPGADSEAAAALDQAFRVKNGDKRERPVRVRRRLTF